MGENGRGIYDCVSRGSWGRKSKSNYGVIARRELTVRNAYDTSHIHSLMTLILTILANNLTIPTIEHLQPLRW